MRILRFRAENFRNISSCDLSFSENVNLFLGENAQGKTNAIEGIYFFARGKSFRGASEKDLLKFSEEGFRLSIDYLDKEGEEHLEYSVFGKEKRKIKNGYPVKSAGEMIGSFRAVLFSPDDLSLIKEGPEMRRAFLNAAIAQEYPAYIRYYSLYARAHENRNCLLKAAQKGFSVGEDELIAWSESMADYASYLYVYRKNYVEKLSPHAKRILKEISDRSEELSIAYASDIEEASDERENVKEQYKKILTANISREIAAGTSLFGIHHDDMTLNINGKSARSFASQGQQRSVVLALKLAEGEVSKEINGEYPVFLFDDVLSELDEKRRAYVLSGIGEKQILITACEGAESEKIAENVIRVCGGEYVSSHR